MNNDAMSICVQVFGPEYIPRSGIAGCGNSVFKLLRNWQTVFHSSCTLAQSYQQWMKVPVALYLCQHLLLPVLLIVAAGMGTTLLETLRYRLEKVGQKNSSGEFLLGRRRNTTVQNGLKKRWA